MANGEFVRREGQDGSERETVNASIMYTRAASLRSAGGWSMRVMGKNTEAWVVR